MAESKSILHELYVFSEWKPEPEYLQKHDSILPENISALWRWFKFFGPKKSLIDSVTAHKEKQQKWHIALGDEGKVIAVLTDNILEIRTKRSEYATIAARTTVSRDAYAQWRKLVWSPDCSFLVLAYGNGIVSFFDLTASNLFNIPADCSRPGGLECTDNTHAVSDIIFMPLRVKDTKWNCEVLVVTFDGRLRGYVVSQTEGFKLRHSFRFPAGVAALAYCPPHDALYVAGVPRNTKDTSPLSAGVTAWRILNEEPFYKLSVVSDHLETQLNNERFNLYIPFITSKNMNFVVRMEVSSDSSKLVCVHCNGEVSVWRLPLLRLLQRWPLTRQPHHRLRSPLHPPHAPHAPHASHTPHTKHNDPALYYPADVNWWTNEEIILSRFSGAVSVCGVEDMDNILGKQPEFFQGTPRVTRAHDGAFMVLECESNVLPAKKSSSDETMEVVKVEEEVDESMLELTKELFKTVLFAITDMETFQPKPKKITVVSRVYRLLGVKSTTPTELFSRKIESGNYTEALSLAEQFGLDSDLVYQQQWRKNPVSTDAIDNYLSKVSKKIWAVHQCVDRLPETLLAANDLLRFGLRLTNDRILDEINKDRGEDKLTDPEDITLEDLNSYTSELLRCRHVMLFYKERLRLYESIMKCEKSTYNKEEYDCLRSNSIVHSAVEMAKEGRIEALTCLWPHIRSVHMQMAVLDKLPETINPLDFQHILPTPKPLHMFEHRPPVKVEPFEIEKDWCRKQIFRSIWSSNWSEDATPEGEAGSLLVDYGKWYERRAREIEARSGLASHALALVTLAAIGGGVKGLDNILFHLLTLSTLLYDVNVEDVTLSDLEKKSPLETCKMLMKMTSKEHFVADMRQFVVPFLKRYENLTQRPGACLGGIIDFLESVSIYDLSYILLMLQESELDVCTHIELAERCLFAHAGSDQLELAVDLLNNILKETDGTISSSELVRRVSALEQLVGGATRLAWRGVRVPLRVLRDMLADTRAAHRLLSRLARTLPKEETKPTPQDWESLLKDILELQETLFYCVTKEQCYEIYSSALLASGDAASVRLAAGVLTCARAQPRAPPAPQYHRSVQLVIDSSKQYFNSATSLSDRALELAKCCLTLIEDENQDIKKELDLISALRILYSFGLRILPIQVRLTEDKMMLIEDCLALRQYAFLDSDMLLKLAKLLRIAGDEEIAREGMVLERVGRQALAMGGAAGGATCVAVARRLAALRYMPAAPLLADVAKQAHAYADLEARRALLAAAAAHAAPADLQNVLHDRLNLEMENLQQGGAALVEQMKLASRRQSDDEEFADAVSTPVTEKEDIVPEKVLIFNYLLETFRDKLNLSDNNETCKETTERSVHCPEFYRSLYQEHAACGAHYAYDSFSAPAPAACLGRTLLSWYYTHADLHHDLRLEADVLEKGGVEIIYKDTPLSVACLIHAAGSGWRLARAHHTPAAAVAVLYAALLRCTPQSEDEGYVDQPKQMARYTLKTKSATEEQLATIKSCLEQLAGVLDVQRIRDFGLNVNGLLFSADLDYRREIIYRLAKSIDEPQVRLACALARRHALDELDVWLAHAAQARADTRLVNLMPNNQPDAHTRIKAALWECYDGTEHGELVAVLALLQSVDERPHMHGLTAHEHIKLLKKAKSACPGLDYKLLLSPSSAQELSAHLVGILRPENVGMVGKFLRTLPAPVKLPFSVNSLYTTWLTKHFFSVGANASNKKWMQQYRQCASYFNKLAKEDLLRFLDDTCFSADAVQRVPAGTRNLMLMQAVDYCQQEQENYKFNKNEQSWCQVGEEVTRWARFLDNYHSAAVQALRNNTDIPTEQGWIDLERSHGEVSRALPALSALVLGGLRPAALASLLHCLHLDLPPHALFTHMLAHNADDIQSIELVASRVCQYHKEGVQFPEEVVCALTARAEALQLPPHRLLGLLALSRRTRAPHLQHLAHSTAALLRNEWPHLEYAHQLTDEQLLNEEGRREVFSKFMSLSDSWQKKKALVDVLNCWPPTKEPDGRSLHCEYVHALLRSAEQSEALVLIKLLLREPILDEQEVQWLCESAPESGALCGVWLALLNRCDLTPRLILLLLERHKEWVQKQEIEEELIKDLLENDMFIPLVPTVLYSHTINYIINKDVGKDELNTYTVSWAIDKLKKANYIAEAGQLQLLHIGVPAPLRGFTQSVLYFKNILNQ